MDNGVTFLLTSIHNTNVAGERIQYRKYNDPQARNPTKPMNYGRELLIAFCQQKKIIIFGSQMQSNTHFNFSNGQFSQPVVMQKYVSWGATW